MKKVIITIICLIFTVHLYAQPQIKFDSLIFDCGIFEEETPLTKKFYFTNIGTEPLVIDNMLTTDGATVPSWSRKPVKPGERDSVSIKYDTRRIGKFEKEGRITQINGADVNIVLKIKGEIYRHPTKIQVKNTEENIGTLKYGEVDTAFFEIINIGPNNLYLDMFSFVYNECDLKRLKIELKDSIFKELKYYKWDYNKSYKPGDTLLVMAIIKNLYGNTGEFERNLLFKCNSIDTLCLKIKGQYTDKPFNDIIYDGDKVCYYLKDKLIKVQFFEFDGRLIQENFFKNSYCYKSIEYPFDKGKMTKENYYKNGKLIETRTYKSDD